MPEPILLHDDGLRLVIRGEANGYTFHHHQNPALIAQVIGERRRRKMIRRNNEQVLELDLAA